MEVGADGGQLLFAFPILRLIVPAAGDTILLAQAWALCARGYPIDGRHRQVARYNSAACGFSWLRRRCRIACCRAVTAPFQARTSAYTGSAGRLALSASVTQIETNPHRFRHPQLLPLRTGRPPSGPIVPAKSAAIETPAARPCALSPMSPCTAWPGYSGWWHSRGVFRPALALAISSTGLIERFGLGVVAHVVVQQGQVVQADGIVGVIFAQRFLLDVQRLPVERLGLGVVAACRDTAGPGCSGCWHSRDVFRPVTRFSIFERLASRAARPWRSRPCHRTATARLFRLSA